MRSAASRALTGPVALAGDDVAHAPAPELDGRLRDRLAGRRGVGDDAPRLDVEVRRPAPSTSSISSSSNDASAASKVWPAGLELLDPVGDPGRPARGPRRSRQVEAELAALQLDGRAARHVGDQQAHVVADADRVHVLVEVGVDLDRGRVQAGLVGEGAGADVRLARGRRHVGHLGDGVRDPGGVPEQARGQHLPVQLELEVGHHRDQVGVAGALAVPVDGALHVGRARPRPRPGCWRPRSRCRCGSGCRSGPGRPRARRGRRRRPSPAACRRWCRTARPPRRPASYAVRSTSRA